MLLLYVLVEIKKMELKLKPFRKFRNIPDHLFSIRGAIFFFVYINCRFFVLNATLEYKNNNNNIKNILGT